MENEHVERHPLPRPAQHQAAVERLLEAEHPALVGREGEGEVVLDAEAEEDVLQGGAARLVGLGEGDLLHGEARRAGCWGRRLKMLSRSFLNNRFSATLQ